MRWNPTTFHHHSTTRTSAIAIATLLIGALIIAILATGA